MKIISLFVHGSYATVFDENGKEVTRREGFSDPTSFFIIFPLKENLNFKVLGAKVLSSRIEVIPEIKMELPRREKQGLTPIIKKRTFISNWHSPMSINVKTGELIENQEYRNASKAKQCFIENHEKGHFFYNTEKYCDLYASLQCINSGYGKSQCLEVLRNMLSDSPQKTERYNFVKNELKKLK